MRREGREHGQEWSACLSMSSGCFCQQLGEDGWAEWCREEDGWVVLLANSGRRVQCHCSVEEPEERR